MPLNSSWLDRQRFPANFGLFALLVLMTATITLIYVSSEHTFYWWDFLNYHAGATDIAIAFRESPHKAIQQVYKSIAGNYNRLFTLPLLPFLLAFGNSRLVYILSLALVYLLPFSLALGAIATKLIPRYPRAVFWLTALLTLLTPTVWASTLRGYPDTGGALLIALAVLVYLQDVKLKQWWQIPLIGFLLAAAILFRRHFAYAVIAFLGAITLCFLIVFWVEVRLHRRRAWQRLLKNGVRVSLIAATSFATLVTCAWEFTYRALTIDYKTLYAAWSLPFREILQRYASFYGWATWMLVLLGFAAGILTRRLALPSTIFILLSGIISLIEWLVILRYGYVHYTLHVTPLVVLEIVAFIGTAWDTLKGKIRTLMLCAAGVYLVCNIVIGLTPMGAFNNSVRPLFAASYPPLVRKDYDEILRLVEYLRQLTPDREPIYVVAASNLFNLTVVTSADQTLHGQAGRRLNILSIPQVDSRDYYPLNPLLQAQYVVIPTPFQHILPTDEQVLRTGEQDVVRVVFDAFNQNWEIAQDFKQLPVEFVLDKGVKVSVYQRIRPTSLETSVRTLSAMQQQIGERPSGQSDWITLSQSLPITAIGKNSGDRNSTPRKVKSFLYLGALSEKVEVTGAITFLNDQCTSASLKLAMLNQAGDIANFTEVEDLNNSSRFKLSIKGQNAAYLLLDVLSGNKNDLVDSCRIEINSLTLSKPK